MDSSRSAWVRAAMLVGVAYFIVGRVFAAPTTHVQAWRFAAWAASFIAYFAHIAYEHVMLRYTPRVAAVHVAAAVAIGAFLLAVAGMIHSVSVGSGLKPIWFAALVLWPAFTSLPAFVGALVAAHLLQRFPVEVGSRRLDR